MGCGVPAAFEDLGDGDFAFQQVRFLGFVEDPIVNACSDVLAPGEQGGPRWRADRAARIENVKFGSLSGERIDGWSVYRAAIAAEVARAEIVG